MGEIREDEIEFLGREIQDITEDVFVGLCEELSEVKHICIFSTPAFFLTRLPAN